MIWVGGRLDAAVSNSCCCLLAEVNEATQTEPTSGRLAFLFGASSFLVSTLSGLSGLFETRLLTTVLLDVFLLETRVGGGES